MRPAFPALLALLLLAAPARALEHVRRVVDGDTVVRLSGETVRVVGLDAPEKRARCEAERRRAASATVRTRELVAGGVDYLVPRIGRTTDRYGRQLRRVVLRDGRDLAAVLIGEGLAVEYQGRGARRDWCGGALEAMRGR